MRRGWFQLATGAGLGRIFGFISNLMLSRWLGPVDLGVFNLVATTVQTCDTLVRCGGDYALNYELNGKHDAINSQRGNTLARGFVQLCSIATILVCISIFAWTWLGKGLFPNAFHSSYRLYLIILLIVSVVCEGSSASAWEILLASQRTGLLSLRQGLFLPLRLSSAAVSAFYYGVTGAICGWTFISLVQCVWLKSVLKGLWNPMHISTSLNVTVRQLIRRGFPFYASNLLASMIFYPLLIFVASGSGLSEIGYLRIGQILQQLFAFLPATLVPVLFLKLRTESSYAEQVSSMERHLRLIWLILLLTLLIYCVIDKILVVWLFGSGFVSALQPTRLLLITGLFECLAQLVVQPLLAAGKTRFYSLCQNGSAVLAAVLGCLWIPSGGLRAYLVVKLVFVVIPLIAFSIPLARHLHEPKKLLPLLTITTFLLPPLVFYGDHYSSSTWLSTLSFSLFAITLFFQRHDLLLIIRILRPSP